MKQIIFLVSFLLHTSIVFGQNNITIDFKINLTTCFAPQQIDWFSAELIKQNDTLSFLNENGISRINLTPNTSYKLEIDPLFNNEIYTKTIRINNADSTIIINDCIGKEIPLNELETNEFDAQKDIKNGRTILYVYYDLELEILKIAEKYGYPIHLLNNVAENYQFSFKITGCKMNERYRQGFYRYNKYVNNHLSSQYSKDWIENFERKLIKLLIHQKPWYKRLYFKINKKKLIYNSSTTIN